ncbi:MAG TPA: hypothetical protein VMY42_23985 [Thermoguttaceae bacterium]|nr:hypothetical protein [Thermoguttaceae bacterium]
MSTLLEDPTGVIVFGVLAEVVLGIVLFCTQRGVVLWMMLGVALLTAGGVWLEWYVETDVENVEAVVEDVAAAVKENDRQGVLQYFAPVSDAPATEGLRRRVDWAFDAVRFTDARITQLDIEVDGATAEAQLTGVVWFEAVRIDTPRNNYPLPCTVQFRRYGDDWRITDFAWREDPLGSE